MNFTLYAPFILKRYKLHHNHKMHINTFVFLDSETTGLPFEENNKTRITELCLIAIQSDHLSMGVIPRIQNKINLCFNPCKFINIKASEITGLSNELLEFQPNFNCSSYNIIHTFLSIQRKPICLVAHNGNKFDYPILKAEIYKTDNELSDDIVCVDSFLGFRELLSNQHKSKQTAQTQVPFELQDDFDHILVEVVEKIESNFETPKDFTIHDIQKMNETTPTKKRMNCIPSVTKKLTDGMIRTDGVKRRRLFQTPQSYSLVKLYTHLTKKNQTDAHRAESDVNMLIECAAILGQEFVDWCDANAKKFCDIPMMVPGKPIGK